MINVMGELKQVIEVIRKRNCKTCDNIGLFNLFLSTKNKPLNCNECNAIYYMEDDDLVINNKRKLTKGELNCLEKALWNADERDDDYGKGGYWYIPSGGAIKACRKLEKEGYLMSCWVEVQMGKFGDNRYKQRVGFQPTTLGREYLGKYKND
jgi:hypothetical protein